MNVSVKNVTKCFTAKGTPAVFDASFTATSGGITTLLGPSGSGKTTLLRIIAGLEVADQGQVLFDDRDVTRVPVRSRGIGFVFQAFALFNHMTVRRNAFGRQADSFESDITLTGPAQGGIAGPPLRAVFIRAPWVDAAGPGVQILGTDSGTGRIVAVRQGPVLATAFHPELTQDGRLHQLFVDIVRENQ